MSAEELTFTQTVVPAGYWRIHGGGWLADSINTIEVLDISGHVYHVYTTHIVSDVRNLIQFDQLLILERHLNSIRSTFFASIFIRWRLKVPYMYVWLVVWDLLTAWSTSLMVSDLHITKGFGPDWIQVALSLTCQCMHIFQMCWGGCQI